MNRESLLKNGLAITKRRPGAASKGGQAFVIMFFFFGIVLLVCSYANRIESSSENVFSSADASPPQDLRWTYQCVGNTCARVPSSNVSIVSLTTCQMLCGTPPLWPIPTQKFVFQRKHSKFLKEQIRLVSNATGEAALLLNAAFSIFMTDIANTTHLAKTWMQSSDIKSFDVRIFLRRPQITRLKLDTNESYSLKVSANAVNVVVDVSADNFFGVRHGLETLSQLIWWDEFASGGMLRVLHDVEIEDEPAFAYRGLMVDTGRNYFSLDQLKRAVVGMAANKLNVLHLHLTDSESFPIVLPLVKQLSQYGSYSPAMVYTEKDIEDLKAFARVRGVRVVLEVDAPSHVNSGWEFGPDHGLGKLVICGEKTHTSGHLNPDNPNTWKVLENIYSSVLRMTGDSEIFHIGNDEVNLSCWQKTEAAHNYTDMMSFWSNYTQKMIDHLKNANNGTLPENVVLWSSPLTSTPKIADIKYRKNLIVQYWFGNPLTFLDHDIRVIFSTVGHWYLDCGFGPWRPDETQGSCDPYTSWQKFYSYKPWYQHDAQELTVGAEACLWTEMVGVDSFETRLWPRTAAFAERVWGDPDEQPFKSVIQRLITQSNRLKDRGMEVAALWPRWCSQNPEKC